MAATAQDRKVSISEAFGALPDRFYTYVNVSEWPQDKVEALRRRLAEIEEERKEENTTRELYNFAQQMDHIHRFGVSAPPVMTFPKELEPHIIRVPVEVAKEFGDGQQ